MNKSWHHEAENANNVSAHTRWSQSTTGGDCTPVVRYIIASKKKKARTIHHPKTTDASLTKNIKEMKKKTFVKRNKLASTSSLKTIENHVDETEIVKTRCVREQ